MIQSRKDYKEYIKADAKAIKKVKLKGTTGKYLLWLRRTEFHLNTKHRLRYKMCNCVLRLISVVTGICIPPNVFGKGLGLFHYGSIIVNPTARFGDNCAIQVGTNIAANVVGGEYIYIAPGAKINNNVHIADHIIIASNAVLTRDADIPYSTYAGVPARKISDKGWEGK